MKRNQSIIARRFSQMHPGEKRLHLLFMKDGKSFRFQSNQQMRDFIEEEQLRRSLEKIHDELLKAS